MLVALLAPASYGFGALTVSGSDVGGAAGNVGSSV